MTVVFSTSSPWVSVAIFDEDGRLLGSVARQARMNASAAALSLLEHLMAEHHFRLQDCRALIADVGPGSFTGTRVAVTIVKTLGYSLGVVTRGITAFDLISCDNTVYVPCKREEFFVREIGKEPRITTSVPEQSVGYGIPGTTDLYPLAERLCTNCRLLEFAPEALVPIYIAPPSISLPKDPRTLGGPHA